VNIIRGVSLEVHKGEIVTITEPNGSGKPTLMKPVFGLVELRSGKIQFDGSDLSRFSLLIVEQNAKKSLAMGHRGYVLEMGKNRFEGAGQSLLTNMEVSALYLGG
jgi:neutral amino acid transport system ATP-binding protein